MDRAEPVPLAEAGLTAGPLIAIPFYRNPQLVAPVLGSLAACTAELAGIGAELVLYNDSPDEPALAAALAAAPRVGIPYRVESNPENLGFVRTMNRAIAEAVARKRDLLLLNSDTRVEPGAIAEMCAVAALDPMIGFVNPRSNNATIATLPVAGGAPAQSEAFASLAARLPRFSFVPTCVGFCMLVRHQIIAEFGGFDEIYGQGYNEENDLVMRAARCGYRAVLANHAFVWHDGEASFGAAAQTREVLERRNRAILDARYPEYARHTAAYSDSPEAIAERLLATLIPDATGRRALALDFSSFRTDHNGTFRAGRQLLEAAAERWMERWRLSVIATEEVYRFHDYASVGVPRSDPHAPQLFAAIFRVGQPYDWNAVQRLCMRGAAIGVFMLDAISLDCPQLTSPRLHNMWQFTLNHADLIATQSRHTAAAFSARFRMPERAVQIISPHSLDLSDYRFPSAPASGADGTLLVIGNHFHHKYLGPTAAALASAFPGRRVVALGQRRIEPHEKLDLYPNLIVQPAGERGEAEIGALYRAADAVIFPSHNEGFGFPLLHALAAERPVFVRDLPLFRELRARLGGDPNIHLFCTTADLVAMLRDPPCWIAGGAAPADDGIHRAAREIMAGIDASIERVSYDTLVARVRAMQFASDTLVPEAGPAPGTAPAAVAAHFLARRVEHMAHRVLSFPPAYAAARLAFRAARLGRTRRG